MEKGKWKKKETININAMIFFNTIYLASLQVYAKFEYLNFYRS